MSTKPSSWRVPLSDPDERQAELRECQAMLARRGIRVSMGEIASRVLGNFAKPDRVLELFKDRAS